MTYENRDAYFWFGTMLTAVSMSVFAYYMGRGDGTRSVCKPEHFPRGTIGRAIAECNELGGFPNINMSGRFECSKRVEIAVP